jgi:hypothetical protein
MKNLLSASVALASSTLILSIVIRGATQAQVAEIPLNELPNLRDVRTYRTDQFIRVATILQALGKDKACETLQGLGKGIKPDMRVIVLCRLLFTRKADGEFRRPRIGAANYLGDTENEDWPLAPIELIDGVPFLIATGYRGTGVPESAESYLRYCIKNCEWNSYQFKAQTMQDKQKALEKLLASRKWRSQLCEEEKSFLASQIR